MDGTEKNGARARGAAEDQAGAGGGAREFFLALWVGFIVFSVVVPAAAARGLETESGAWLHGVNVGVILGIGVIGAGVVAAVVNAMRGD